MNISSFYTLYQKLWLDDVRFLRNGVRRTERRTEGWKKWPIEEGAPPKNKQSTVWIGTDYTEKLKPNVLIHYPIYSIYALSKISPKFANLQFHYCNCFNLVYTLI